VHHFLTDLPEAFESARNLLVVVIAIPAHFEKLLIGGCLREEFSPLRKHKFESRTSIAKAAKGKRSTNHIKRVAKDTFY